MRHLCTLSIAVLVLGLLATPAASQGSDDICASMIVPLIVQSGLDAEVSAPALGCRQNDRGEWFMPTVSDIADPSVELSSCSLELLDAVDRMSGDAAFGNSLKFNRQDSEAIVPGPGGADTVDVSDYNLGAVPSWLHNLEDNYMLSMQTYLTRTAGQEVDLVLYMQWFMARRDTTLSVITQQMNPMSGPAFLSNWGYQQFPWPWQSADPEAIAAYFDENPPSDTSESVSTTSGAELTLTPDKTVARPGDIVTVTLDYPRLQGIHSVAFMYYAEQIFALNVPRYLLDSSGDLACSVGSEGDPVEPIQRATDLAMAGDFPPSYLELEIDPSAQDGDRLSVCVEMVGFAVDREVFAWNARIDVTVAD